MKRNQQHTSPSMDSPAIRKRRLQKRLQEISTKSEEELATLVQSIEKLKGALKAPKP